MSKGTKKGKDRSSVQSLRINLIPTAVEEREKVSIPDSTNYPRTKSLWMGGGESIDPGSTPRMTTTLRVRLVVTMEPFVQRPLMILSVEVSHGDRELSH